VTRGGSALRSSSCGAWHALRTKLTSQSCWRTGPLTQPWRHLCPPQKKHCTWRHWLPNNDTAYTQWTYSIEPLLLEMLLASPHRWDAGRAEGAAATAATPGLHATPAAVPLRLPHAVAAAARPPARPPCRTTDPDEADFFYVPTFSSCIFELHMWASAPSYPNGVGGALLRLPAIPNPASAAWKAASCR
jgi:hypothetical protein